MGDSTLVTAAAMHLFVVQPKLFGMLSSMAKAGFPFYFPDVGNIQKKIRFECQSLFVGQYLEKIDEVAMVKEVEGGGGPVYWKKLL